MATPQPISFPQLNFEDYLDYVERSERKSEFLHGVVYAMCGAGHFHNNIASNCSFALRLRLNSRGCEVLVADQMVVTSRREAGFYPDVLVICDGPAPQTNQPVDNPLLVVEVLSPSTRAFDTSTKLAEYQRIASLRHILFVESVAVEAKLYSRGEGEVWPGTPRSYCEREAAIEFAALGISIELGELYQNLAFPTA